MAVSLGMNFVQARKNFRNAQINQKYKFDIEPYRDGTRKLSYEDYLTNFADSDLTYDQYFKLITCQAAKILEYTLNPFRIKLGFKDKIKRVKACRRSKRGKYFESLKLLEELIEKNPRCSTLYNDLGYTLHMADNNIDAIIQYRKALELDPYNITAMDSLGYALIQERQFDEVISVYSRELKFEPKMLLACHRLGLAYFKKGLIIQAIVERLDVLEMDSDQKATNNVLNKVINMLVGR